MTTLHPPHLDSTGTYQQADNLRAAGPATRITLPAGMTAWSVTRGDVIKYLLTHPHVSKDPRRSWPGGFDPARIPAWLGPWIPASMFNADGADHARLRKLTGRAFTPRRIEALRPVLERIVTTLLHTLTAQPPGVITDLRAAYAYRVPTNLICDLFGVPDEQRPIMLRVMDAAIDTQATPAQAAANNATMAEAIRQLIRYKRARPGDDMTSQLLEHHEGDRLTQQELEATLILMVGAGSQTAVSLINQSSAALLTHPGALATALRDGRWDDVIEETLRRDPPILHIPLRYITGTIDLGDGVIMQPGDFLMVGFGAHGRDPGQHAEPGEWNLDREDKSHLAFGYGTHYCLGAALARLEAQVALPALFRRFPEMRLAVEPGELRRQDSFIANDLAELPVRLRPAT